MARVNHISVEIEAQFGSAFQEETAVRILHKYINAWREFFEEKHSNNAIKFRITNADRISPPLKRVQARRHKPAIC